jgi:hypothetical protein
VEEALKVFFFFIDIWDATLECRCHSFGTADEVNERRHEFCGRVVTVSVYGLIDLA